MLEEGQQLITAAREFRTWLPFTENPIIYQSYILQGNQIYKTERRTPYRVATDHAITFFQEDIEYTPQPDMQLIGSREPRWPVIRSLRKPRKPTSQLSIGNQPLFQTEGESETTERILAIVDRPATYKLQDT